MITAPIPTSTSSSTVQPWTTARCPTVTFSPTEQGNPGSACSTEPSWMFEPAPTEIASLSARTTAEYQMPTSAPRVTRPATTAPGAIQAVGSTCGVWPSTVTSSGSMDPPGAANGSPASNQCGSHPGASAGPQVSTAAGSSRGAGIPQGASPSSTLSVRALGPGLGLRGPPVRSRPPGPVGADVTTTGTIAAGTAGSSCHTGSTSSGTPRRRDHRFEARQTRRADGGASGPTGPTNQRPSTGRRCSVGPAVSASTGTAASRWRARATDRGLPAATTAGRGRRRAGPVSGGAGAPTRRRSRRSASPRRRATPRSSPGPPARGRRGRPRAVRGRRDHPPGCRRRG